jgi:two-component system chemotaxis sensor kinase CheA
VRAERVLELAKSHDPTQAVELVFMPGLSTRKGRDAMAGRGVGLDAVRRELARIGYEVVLRFAQGVGTTITISPKRPTETLTSKEESSHV